MRGKIILACVFALCWGPGAFGGPRIPIKAMVSTSVLFASEELLVVEVQTRPPDQPVEIVALGIRDGTVRWRKTCQRIATSNVSVEQRSILAVSGDALICFSLDGGRELWRTDLASIPRAIKPGEGESENESDRVVLEPETTNPSYFEYAIPYVTGKWIVVFRECFPDNGGGCCRSRLWGDWLAVDTASGKLAGCGLGDYAGHSQSQVILARWPLETKTGVDAILFPVTVQDRASMRSLLYSRGSWFSSPYSLGERGLAEEDSPEGKRLLVFDGKTERALPIPWPREDAYQFDWALTPQYLVAYTSTVGFKSL